MAYIIPRIDLSEIKWEDISENALALDITQSIKDFKRDHPTDELTIAHIMAFTQRAWRLNPNHANNCDLIFACYRPDSHLRIIVGVLQFGRDIESNDSNLKKDGFVKSEWDGPDSKRYVFLAEPASEKEWNKYVGLLLPERKKGETNPVKYIEQTK